MYNDIIKLDVQIIIEEKKIKMQSMIQEKMCNILIKRDLETMMVKWFLI